MFASNRPQRMIRPLECACVHLKQNNAASSFNRADLETIESLVRISSAGWRAHRFSWASTSFVRDFPPILYMQQKRNETQHPSEYRLLGAE